MRKLLCAAGLCFFLILPVSAAEFTAPEVPESGRELMPEETESFGEGLLEMLGKALTAVEPELQEAGRACVSVTAAVLLVSLLESFSDPVSASAELAGTAAVSGVLLMASHTLIRLGADTVTEISEYGKLLLPVMTAALAAQGGLTASTALFTGTAAFSALLSSLIAKLLVPMIYLFLALAAAHSALGEGLLKQLRDLTKGAVSWSLRLILTVFTTYMAITGVVSGTTDAAALKAAKLTVSTVVPVVGGILSDASEAILVGAGVVKNAAGLYGIFAVLAVCLRPFLRIGCHYLLMKATAGICSVIGSKRLAELVGDFSAAMGLLLAMTGSACLMLLISTVCFMKGVG